MIHIGDSGWRAIYSDGFTWKNLSATIRALAELHPAQKVLIGYDNRFLSQDYALHVAALLQQHAWQVTLLPSMFPTPGVAKLLREYKFDWGLMITASHNPYFYNGIKIFNRHGTLTDHELNEKLSQRANELANDEASPFLPGKQQKLLQELAPPFDATAIYFQKIFANIDIAKIQKAKLKIAWDSFGGVTTFLFPEFLKMLHVENQAVPMFLEPTFQHRRLEPDENSLEKLSGLVKSSQSNLGLATDVDGDRFAVIDEGGRYVLNNTLGSLLVWYLLEVRKERGNIYQTVSCSSLTQKICDAYGTVLQVMPVGFQAMGKAMIADKNPLLGIEETGGFAYAPYLFFKDGLMAHALILEMLATQQKSLSELIDDMHAKFGCFFYQRFDLRLRSEAEKKSLLDEQFWEAVTGEKVVSQLHIDGSKWFFKSGWILIRDSKTEALLRIYCEAENNDFVAKVTAKVATFS